MLVSCGGRIMRLLVLFAAFVVGTGDLSSDYLLSTTLHRNDHGDVYKLHWHVDIEDQTVHFAVNVSTKGWVGFGLSPNGGMPGSDVVIGWVDDSGEAFLNDRYAESKSRPSVDTNQDWFLIGGREEGGFTILEFWRYWITCDENDKDIEANTARIIFSWNDSDPPNNDPDAVEYHGPDSRGTTSVNLLGGLHGKKQPPEPTGEIDSFFVGAENTLIPGDQDTTYKCIVKKFPEKLTTTKYIYKHVPRIQSNNTAFVHHMLVYGCKNYSRIGEPECFDVRTAIADCTEAYVLGGWAIGGGEFRFPEGVAYPVGGPNHYAIIQIHYNNPGLKSGVYDNSGVDFFYTNEEPDIEAGQFILGSSSSPAMMIPPNTKNFISASVCPVACTETFFPEGGIKIFGNLLHSHLLGRSMTFEHYRMNAECGVMEQLEPIDINLQYDSDFQQNTLLTREVTVLPGDVLVVKCVYDTVDTAPGPRDGVTTGGGAILDEMCLSYPMYYPSINFQACLSIPASTPYINFIEDFVPSENQAIFYSTIVTGDLYSSSSRHRVKKVFDQLEWNQKQVDGLQQTVLNSSFFFCGGTDQNKTIFNTEDAVPIIPNASCYYEAPDPCTGSVPQSCCERLGLQAGVPAMSATSFVLATLVMFVSFEVSI